MRCSSRTSNTPHLPLTPLGYDMHGIQFFNFLNVLSLSVKLLMAFLSTLCFVRRFCFESLSICVRGSSYTQSFQLSNNRCLRCVDHHCCIVRSIANAMLQTKLPHVLVPLTENDSSEHSSLQRSSLIEINPAKVGVYLLFKLFIVPNTIMHSE